ncbi:MAG TPA: serine protease [Blastocatellia bacterium]|nr:serine protease [Blastocatellia bacterium]
MSRAMFVYLSGSEKGKTRIFTQDRVTIGTSEDSDLKLVPEEGGALPVGVLAGVYNDENTFHFVPQPDLNGTEITVNGEPLQLDETGAGHVLRDGDTLHFGHGLSSASVLFQVMPENFSATALSRRRPVEVEPVAAQPVHPLTATLFVKELTASLWAEIPRRAKWFAIALFSLLTLVAAGTLVFVLVTLVRLNHRTEDLRDQVVNEKVARDRAQDLINQQQDEINRLRKSNEDIQQSTQRIAEQFSPGVCLIVGSFSFVERGTGRPLRYESADSYSDQAIDKNGHLLLSVDGAGGVYHVDYTGTGFIVEEGLIATNKHVVQPWASDPVTQILQAQGNGYTARLDSLVAFFPAIKEPFDLKVASTSVRYDVAMCKFEQGSAALPVLPMTEDTRTIVGEPVVLLGFPTGVDGLLQRIDESEKTEILRLHRRSVTDVAQGLAERGLIRPLTTTGTISDALPGKIVHSAQTTEGGSGSPIFDRQGRVVAINSAILTTIDGGQSFGGSNFGVPIKIALEMLQAYDRSNPKPAADH